MESVRTNNTARALLEVGLVLLGLAWLVLPAWFVFGAAITSASFFGDSPSASDQAEAGRLLVRAGITAVVLPALGLAVASWLGRTGARAVFGVALAIGAVAAVVLIGAAPQVAGEVPAPAPTSSPRCQEHSGGDTTCPGG